MGYKLNLENMNLALKELKKTYRIYAPKVFEGAGTFSDTDRVRYGEVSTIEEIEFDKKSSYSYKETILPTRQTLFFFNDDECKEAEVDERPALVFLRSCEIHSVKRIDDIYLRNGFEDIYYKKMRENAKFILIGCENSFENCFCVSMGSNKTDEYNAYIKVDGQDVYLDVKDEEIAAILDYVEKEEKEVTPDFVTENPVKVNIPENLGLEVMKSTMWNEYNERCITCGRCNFVCPTCTCFTMQDITYKDMAGGHSFRKEKGQKMRFKTLHKVYDYKKKWGYHMCVGCGRCDDICPEYISFSTIINKLEDAMNEVKNND